MIFSQQERFSFKPSIDVNHSDIYVPTSMLSSKGTKIVDSWCGIDSPRLDPDLVIKNGVLLKCKKDWNENLSILDLPDISKTKSKLPSYSFPKSKKRGGIDEKQNQSNGSVYNIPSCFENDPMKGTSFGYGERSTTGFHSETFQATVLSLERASVCEQATKKMSPRISLGVKYASSRVDNNNSIPGPGAYHHSDFEKRHISGIKYVSPTTTSKVSKKPKISSPGPGEYNINDSLIKPSFNKANWKPKLPPKNTSEFNFSSQPPNKSNNNKNNNNNNNNNNKDNPALLHPSLKTEAQGMIKPSKVRPAFNRRARLNSTEIDSSSKRHILHEQRKVSFTILRDLVHANTIQLKLPVMKILKALQQVQLFKCLSIDQLQRVIYLLVEAEYVYGDYIIKQGDAGESFFILLSGSCDCTINQPDGTEKLVFKPKEYDYFGEKALLNSAPRAANVIARSDVKVLYLEKKNFEEVFGSLADIIQEDAMKRKEITSESPEN